MANMELEDLLDGELLAWLTDSEPDTVNNSAGTYGELVTSATAASASVTTGSTPKPGSGSTLLACTPISLTSSSSHPLPTFVRFVPPKTDERTQR